jgi:hypothetical protein
MKISKNGNITMTQSELKAMVAEQIAAALKSNPTTGNVVAKAAGPRTLAVAREEGAVRWVRNMVARPVAKATAKAIIYSANKSFDAAEVTVAYAEPAILEATATTLETSVKAMDYVSDKAQTWGEVIRARREARRFVAATK